MTPIELTVRGSDDIAAYACSQCRIVARTRDDAASCCQPRQCATCGVVIGNSWCEPCFANRIAREETARFAAASAVPCREYSGPLHTDHVAGGDWGDGYFSDEDALRDACATKNVPMPAYAWACVPSCMELSAVDIVESELEQAEAHDGAADMIPAVAFARLQRYLSAWTTRYSPTSWHPDYTRAVVFETTQENT